MFLSIVAAMMPLLDRTAGSFLSITQINDLHIEASLGANFNNDNAAGYSVPLSVIHGSSPEEDSCETSLLCYLASGSKTVSDLRASNSTIPPPNRALLALHIRSAPLKALGLTPLHDRSVFYLPIAWIDVRNPTHIKSRPGGYVSNARVQGSNAPLGSGQKPLGPKIPSGARFNGGINTVPNNLHNPVLFPTQAVKPIIGMFGDWNCPQCKSLVFSFRLDCFKCRTPRPVSGPHIVPRQPQKTSSKPDGDIRDGDWLCACCNGHNFANKLACFTCRTVKHQDPIDESIARHPTDPADPNSVPSATDSLKAPERASKLMPGDWTCPSCSENVFAKRRRCYKCCTLKPR